MRLSVTAKLSASLETRLRARTARQRQKVLEATAASGRRVRDEVIALTPKDTWYMADHVRLEITGQGDGYRVGWRAQDFVGQTNPTTGRVIDSFYPVYVVHGTRYMAGRDPLTPALQAERPIYRKTVARALSGG